MTSVQGLSGMYGYPNPYQVTANPAGAAAMNLNAEYMRDFGLNNAPVYNLPMDVNMGFGMPGMGAGMGMGMGMYGMGMGMGMLSPQYMKYMNLDYKDRLAYDHDLRNTAREFDYTEGKDAKNYACAADGLTGSIKATCHSLQTAIKEGESDQIVKKYENIAEMLRRSPLYTRLKEEHKNEPLVLEQTLRNSVREEFQAATGQDLTAMIQENCDGTIANSFFNTLSFGNAQKYSSDEIVARMDGLETPKSVRTKQIAGKTGGVLAAAGAGAVVGTCIPIVGTTIGAIVGGIIGVIGAVNS